MTKPNNREICEQWESACAPKAGVPREELMTLLIDGAFTSDGRLSRKSASRLLQSAADALIELDPRRGRE